MIADSKLAKYFAPRELDLRDWDVMTGIPPDSFCRLNPEVCDPVTAGLVNEQEVLQYFKLYFKIRHPSVGILDPDLHTAEYVHGCSFTLFSVICALGCELSMSHRDILLAPLLYNMAERNIKWSILNSVKTVEIIQAIIMFTFWSHAAQNYADDPSWLRFGHALSIARELKINDSLFIQKKVNNFNASNRNIYTGIRDRQVRNYERTWIFVFLMDKSFGITIGRAPCVSWKEMQPELHDWARAAGSAAGDLAITGIVQLRINLLQALERLFSMQKTLSSITEWDRSASSRLEELKGTSYSRQDGTQLESMFAAVFTFEVTHGLLLIRNNTYKHLVKLNAPQDKINNVLHDIFNISCEIIRLFVHDPRLSSLASGYHNTPFVMISHAATEIIRVSVPIFSRNDTWAKTEKSFKCPAISQDAQEQASTLIRNLAEHFGRIANKLPSTSWASLYLEYSLFLVRKLENIPCVASRGLQGTLDHHTGQSYSRISISLDNEPQSSPNAWDFNGAAFFEMGNSLWQDNSASFLGVDSGQGSLFGGTEM
ncbi:unnamed protein product [Clonostachys rosea]|uniref:Xylanolytic transcriptional activator regulatory domain-containing protein n=1 Tax=Bionectria ochroleuca TaxID=29856 RepID=A0ABY6UGI5_BIOOC|nr:unnamed protein product [Clonostachys rosea]